jgi:hypothetical protein
MKDKPPRIKLGNAKLNYRFSDITYHHFTFTQTFTHKNQILWKLT